MTGNETVILGLDPSLASTGVAWRLDNGDWRTQAWSYKQTFGRLPTKEPRETINWLVFHMELLLTGLQPDIVVCEGPAYGATGNVAHIIAGVWWRLTSVVTDAGIPLVIIPPTSLKKWATGNGRASKKDVQYFMRLRTGMPLKTTDEADAIALAELGEYVYNETDEVVSGARLKAIKEDNWPPPSALVRGIV